MSLLKNIAEVLPEAFLQRKSNKLYNQYVVK